MCNGHLNKFNFSKATKNGQIFRSCLCVNKITKLALLRGSDKKSRAQKYHWFWKSNPPKSPIEKNFSKLIVGAPVIADKISEVLSSFFYLVTKKTPEKFSLFSLSSSQSTGKLKVLFGHLLNRNGALVWLRSPNFTRYKVEGHFTSGQMLALLAFSHA